MSRLDDAKIDVPYTANTVVRFTLLSSASCKIQLYEVSGSKVPASPLLCLY
jgi:hypothetical protein